MKKLGRKSLCTPALTKKICAVLEKANTVTTACAVVGIGTSTYHSWIARGENGEPEYREFADSCARAKAKAKQRLTNIIFEAAMVDARHAEWLLEKLYPREYGRDASEPMPPQSREAAELAEKEFREAMQLMEKADNIERAARNASN